MKDEHKTKQRLTNESAELRPRIAELETVEAEGKRVEETVQWSRMWLSTVGTFVLLCILVWLNEVLDIPHLLLGAPRTPINWQEAIIETVLVLTVGLLAVFRLIHDITERKRAEERIVHLNAVLRAIRSVNQLIIREKNRARLLQGVCDCLIETRGYGYAWIALLDEAGGLVMTTEAGLGEGFLPMIEQMERGELPVCGRKALKQSETVVTKGPLFACAGCPLSASYGNQVAMTARLEHGGRVYGLLTVSSPAGLIADEEEQALLKEVARDIALALHGIELEERRKRAAEALWIKDSAIASSINGIALADLEGNLTYVNPSFLELWGYDDDKEILGKSAVELWQSEEKAAEVIEASRGGESRISELVARRKDGSLFDVQFSASMVTGEAGKPVCLLGSFVDITGRKRAEEALRRYVERLRALRAIDVAILAAWSPEEIAQVTLRHFRQLVPCLGAGVVTFDFEAQEATLFAAYINGETGLGEGTHFPLEEVAGVEALRRGKVLVEEDTLAPSQPPPAMQALQAAGVRSYVAVPLIAQGELIGALTLGAENPGAFAPEYVDITREVADQFAVALRQAHLRVALEAEEQRLEALMEHLPEGILLLDGERRILLSNPAAQTCLPLLTDAAVGDVLTLMAGHSVEELLQPPPEGLWHELEVAGPPRRVFEIVAQPIAAETGAGGWVVLIRDVTQERDIQGRIQQQERLAAVGQLAAGIAHDFNNIMATIVLYAQMLSQTEGLSSRDLEWLATINQQAKHAVGLIQQILDFSRRSVLERQPMDLLPLVKEQVKLLERTLPENIEIKLVYGRDEYTVYADPTRMQQVVMNLGLNARDAMPEGGKLRFGLERIQVQPGESPPLPEMALRQVQGAEASEWVRVTVSDTGTGIPPDVLPHIFDPFFTTKAPGGGSGLGLAQVYGIVKQHEGEIGVQSQVGQGTTFTIHLPALPVHPAEAPARELPALTEGQGETILVVEDDAAVRKALVDSLELLNYRVLAAANGREALAILERQTSEVSEDFRSLGIALVLSDVVMPGMGGIALLQALKERGLAVRVVMLTGHPLEEELESLRAQGMIDWLLKPPSLERLAEVLARRLKGDQTGGLTEPGSLL